MNMKKLQIIILITLLSGAMASAQSLSVFDVNIDDYPVIKAKFFALDANDSTITNLTESDFKVYEDGIERDVILVSCPQPEPPKALSAVLTIDVSGSMAGQRIGFAKAAAIEWVNALIGKSECAISSFNTVNFFVQDFTTDKNKLKAKINGLGAGGGTNYEAGFIDTKAGGLLVAEPGKYKKVLVFLSDGGPNFPPDEAKIIQKAQKDSVTIFCVTLGMKCPQCLKNFADSTGGLWFENITTEEQAKEIYRNILLRAQGGEPCEIHWLSEGCPVNRTANIQIPNYSLSTDVSYTTPVSELPHLEITPGLSMRFGNIEPGTTAEQDIAITARVDDIIVTDITLDNSYYSITDYGGSSPTFTLPKDDSRTMKVEFAPQDSAYQLCKFVIESNACGGNKFYASGGDIFKRAVQQSIHLIHPNGGERFLVGSDTVITWEDVLPSDTVLLDYSTNGGKSWIFITDTATGLTYDWHVPDTPSDSCLARVSIGLEYDYGYDMVLIPAGSFQMGNTGSYSAESDELPDHKVIISKDFLMSKYEVTRNLWDYVMYDSLYIKKNDSIARGSISWYDAIDFCNKYSEKEGFEPCYTISGSITCDFNANGFRLPTEAEWEYACKAGSNTDYYNGDLIYTDCTPIDKNLDEIAWYCGNYGNTTKNVGQKNPNKFGLYDMLGNVYEWCWDYYSLYNSSDATDPFGPVSGDTRVCKGGSRLDPPTRCRSSDRFRPGTGSHYSNIGFRIVRVP